MIDYQNGSSRASGHPADHSDLVVTPALSDDIRRYMGLIWHWAWLLIVFVIAGGLIGYFTSTRETPVYRAEATIWISESRTLNEYANILASERLAQTYAQLMVQKPIFEGVINKLNLDMDANTLKNRVSVSVVEETQLLQIRVEDTDPERAAYIANEVGEVFSQINSKFQADRYEDSISTLSEQLDQVDLQIQDTNQKLVNLQDSLEEATMEDGTTQIVMSLEQQRERDRLETNLTLYQQIYTNLLQSLEAVRLAEAQGSSTVNLVEHAEPPEAPFRPNVFQDTSLAAVIGLILGIGVVFLIEALDDTVKGPADVARILGLPVLGYIGHLKEDDLPITAAEPRAPVSEAFRALRTNIQYAGVDRQIRKLLITSATPQDGKSTVAVNLGVVVAQSGKKVAVVDADMRRPSLHHRLRTSNRVGLSDLFVQEVLQLDGSLRETRISGFHLVTSGGLPPNPSELLGSHKMEAVLNQILQVSDMVVIDSPPVMAVTDAAILAPKMDGVVLVIRPGVTKIVHTRQTVEQLRRGGANLLGVVLNDIEHKRSRYYYYYRGYYNYDMYYGSQDWDQPVRQKSRKRKRGKRRTEESELQAGD